MVRGSENHDDIVCVSSTQTSRTATMQVINYVTAADVVFLAWVGYLFPPILLVFELNDVTDADVVFLAWVGVVLMSDWLQKGSLEIVSPSVLRGASGVRGLTGGVQEGWMGGVFTECSSSYHYQGRGSITPPGCVRVCSD